MRNRKKVRRLALWRLRHGRRSYARRGGARTIARRYGVRRKVLRRR